MFLRIPVYPNPASETVNISVGGEALQADILLFNLQGDLLYIKGMLFLIHSIEIFKFQWIITLPVCI